MGRNGAMNITSADSADRGFPSKQQLSSGDGETQWQTEKSRGGSVLYYSKGGRVVNAYALLHFFDASSLNSHFSAPPCGPVLTLYHD